MLVCAGNYSLGWAKCAGANLKKQYPKGCAGCSLKPVSGDERILETGFGLLNVLWGAAPPYPPGRGAVNAMDSRSPGGEIPDGGVERLEAGDMAVVRVVEKVARQRVADGGHVHPNLMGPAGLKAQTHQREIPLAVVQEAAVVGAGRFPCSKSTWRSMTDRVHARWGVHRPFLGGRGRRRRPDTGGGLRASPSGRPARRR